MALRKYEQRWAPELESALGEPILRCIAMNTVGVHSRMNSERSTLTLRPFLMVDGEKHTRIPQTMFLTLTPTRVLITETKSTFLHGFKPRLDAPILVLQRGDSKITATESGKIWFYLLQSVSLRAQLELELLSTGGIAAELAQQLRAFAEV
ncbi:MAG: hypothetical protein QOH57_3412 [Mycobacterium sp.]|jgi:hypothetical protein|nr:hypothetical protein [Mycobacterium sp.]